MSQLRNDMHHRAELVQKTSVKSHYKPFTFERLLQLCKVLEHLNLAFARTAKSSSHIEHYAVIGRAVVEASPSYIEVRGFDRVVLQREQLWRIWETKNSPRMHAH